MRINKEFAETLARRLCDNAMRLEKVALKERQNALAKKVLEILYDGKRELFEALGEPWMRRAQTGYFYLRGEGRYTNMQLDFGEEVALPPQAYNGAGVDIKDPVLMDEIMDINETIGRMWRRGEQMQRELSANIQKARTVKKLLELWPEAAEDIVAVAEQFGGHGGVEVPLSMILKRYNAALLSAPESFEVVEVAA